MITSSKRMMSNNEWSIKTRYEAILVGDAYCGKTKYIKLLAKKEKESNSPILVSDDENEFEFWVESKSNKAIFLVRDTANQERFRSLTQNYYRRVDCVLLIFNLYNIESFYNLNNWYSDLINYCKIKESCFSVVLVGLDYKKTSLYQDNKIELNLIEKFQLEKPYIIGYCEIDLNGNDLKQNFKEPFELLLNKIPSLLIDNQNQNLKNDLENFVKYKTENSNSNNKIISIDLNKNSQKSNCNCSLI